MGSLLNDWIQLFDEENFKDINSQPNEIRKATMLLITLQKEFTKVETLLHNNLQILKSKFEKENTETNTNRKKEIEAIDLCSQSPPRRNTSESIKISMSPTLSRNRKFNAKRVKHLKSQSSSSIIPLGKDVSNTLFAHKNHNTKLNSLVEDEDIFESSIIDTTPNVRTIKKSRNRVTSPRKTLKNLSGNTTLTQKFREMATRVKETKEGETLMETDITEDNFSKPNSLKSSFTSHSSRDDLKICTFARDYDKLPESQKSPLKPYVYKETVRGKAKKKLKGWSCKECEQFYNGLNLTEAELEKKMNECSKHKNRFKPNEETMAGFWDLSIAPTQEEKNTPAISTPSQESNESTIYCFYKN